MLNEGENVAILAGAGALHARDEVPAVADRLGAPVIKTLSGKAVIPDDSEYAVGGIGLLGTRPGEDLVEDCGTLFMIGTNFRYTQHLPQPGKVRVVQIDVGPARAGVRMPVEVPVIGDARESLQALIPLLTRKQDRGHLEKYQKEMAKRRSDMKDLESPKRTPIAPQYPAGVLDRLAADDAVLTCDSGTIATWAVRALDDPREPAVLPVRQPGHDGARAALRPGHPARLPGRQVIAYVGDGGFAMLMAEFLTAVRAGLPVKVVINNNNSLGQILWEQMVLCYPEHGVRFPSPPPTTRPGPLPAAATAPRSPTGSGRARHPGRAGLRRPSNRRHQRRPQRAATARQSRLRPGQKVRPGLPQRPAAQGRHRHHVVQRQDRAAWPLTVTGPVPRAGRPAGRGGRVPGRPPRPEFPRPLQQFVLGPVVVRSAFAAAGAHRLA